MKGETERCYARRAVFDLCASLAFLGAAPASADIVTVTVTGTITTFGSPSREPYFDGIDYGGFFGPAGASLLGDPFMVVWTGTGCNVSCAGGSFYGTPNPLLSPVLTINGISFDFGPGEYGVLSGGYQNVTVVPRYALDTFLRTNGV